MKLHDLKPPVGAKSNSKRLGRGPGSGVGKTSGKGHKGLLARSGGPNMQGFEGGQMPLARRLPKRGFHNHFRIEYTIVNLKSLSSLGEVNEITPQVLREKGIVKKRSQPIKILGVGGLARPLVIQAHSFSKSALQKIQQAGGQARVIDRA